MKQKHLKSIRIAVAAIMFVLFFGVGLGISQLNAVLVTQFGPGLLSLTSVFFVDTLAAVVIIAVATLLFGRIYCSLLCPLGILQDGIAFLAQRIKGKAYRRYRFMDTRPVKYGVFLFVLILGAAGVMLPLIALLPSSNFFTFVSNVILRFFCTTDPEVGTPSYYCVNPPAEAFVFSLGVFLVVAALAAWRGRVYCNTLCPVGAVLSLLGRAPLWRITLSQDMCVCCGLCEAACKGGAINAKKKSVLAENCVMCFNCIPACKRGGVKLEFRPKDAPKFNLSRRHFIGAAGGVAAGAGAAVIARKLEKALPPQSCHAPAMPPGAGNSKRFHEKCVGCGICIRECEGRVLAPSIGQYGLAGFMQPVMDYSHGACVYTCNHCSNVCPAGALLPLSLEVKQTTRVGLASVDAKTCVGCGICASKCPAHAITVNRQDGRGLASVNADYCIGCGVCQDVCPLPDAPAIQVSGVSEQIRVLPPIQLDCAETLAPAEQNADAEQNAAEGEQKADGEQSSAASSKPIAVPIPELCVGCGLCSEECPVSAITMADGLPSVNADACVGCGLCSEACPAPDGPAIVVQG
jgi:ferredoxin